MLLQKLGKPTDEIVILIFLRGIVKWISLNSKVISVFENCKVIFSVFGISPTYYDWLSYRRDHQAASTINCDESRSDRKPLRIQMRIFLLLSASRSTCKFYIESTAPNSETAYHTIARRLEVRVIGVHQTEVKDHKRNRDDETAHKLSRLILHRT